MNNTTKINYALTENQVNALFDQFENDDTADHNVPEQVKYEPTPYNYVLEFLDFFKPKKNDIVYDLGSGFGRVVILSALNCNVKFKGIELAENRVEIANKIKKQFKLSNAEFICKNILDADYSDGDIFFLFNPFTDETLDKVGEELKKIAKNKIIKIATWGGSSNEYFRSADWLKKIDKNNDDTKLEFFESIIY